MSTDPSEQTATTWLQDAGSRRSASLKAREGERLSRKRERCLRIAIASYCFNSILSCALWDQGIFGPLVLDE